MEERRTEVRERHAGCAGEDEKEIYTGILWRGEARERRTRGEERRPRYWKAVNDVLGQERVSEKCSRISVLKENSTSGTAKLLVACKLTQTLCVCFAKACVFFVQSFASSRILLRILLRGGSDHLGS